MAIVTSKADGTILYNESKEQVALNKRRAQFEKNRKKLKAIIVGNNPISANLISFNNGIANAIAEFRQSKARVAI